MNNQESSPDIRDFLNWRYQIYNALGLRKETVMELIDSLSSNNIADSVVELSLNPLFRRNYNSLYKGIQEFLPHQKDENYEQKSNQLLTTVAETIPTPKTRHFYLFGLDATPYPRPHSPTLEDKTYIYKPNPIKGNKPISIGHTYSVLSALPERTETENVPWIVPLLGDRISSNSKSINVGNKQLKKILSISDSWSNQLSVLVADSIYSNREFIGEQVKQDNLVTITRVRSNRVFYRQFISDTFAVKKLGHPRWYGDKFDLKDDTTWHEPDEVVQSNFTSKKGRKLIITISGWKQMLMRGTSNYQMNNHPFTLLQITIKDSLGDVINKPIWLIVIGSRRDELSLTDCYDSYRQRYDLEHFFRFGKQKLFMTAYSTPVVNHEENWFKLTLLAYVNLWSARNLALILPREWEQYLKNNKSPKITPSLVQRDFYRIISQLGSIAKLPKRRGYSSGRIKGYKKVPRTRHQVIIKQKKSSTEKIKVP